MVSRLGHVEPARSPALVKRTDPLRYVETELGEDGQKGVLAIALVAVGGVSLTRAPASIQSKYKGCRLSTFRTSSHRQHCMHVHQRSQSKIRRNLDSFHHRSKMRNNLRTMECEREQDKIMARDPCQVCLLRTFKKTALSPNNNAHSRHSLVFRLRSWPIPSQNRRWLQRPQAFQPCRSFALRMEHFYRSRVTHKRR